MNADTRRKIAVIALDLDRTGISAVIMNYCRRIDRREFDLSLFVGDRVMPEYLEECGQLGIRVNILPLKHRDPTGYYTGLYRLLKQERYEIVHVHGNSAMITPELVIAVLTGIKARAAHSHNTACDHPVIHRLLSPFFGCLYQKAIACSRPAGQWMFGNRPFEVLQNGIDTSRYQYDRETRRRFRERLGIGDAFLVGHAAQYTLQKNHEFLLEVFRKLAEKREDAWLLLAGNGPRFGDVEQKIKKHPYRDRILVLGDLPQIEEAYSAMDLFVLPSLFEGFPVVLVEAQAAGLPCLVSDRITKEVNLSGNVHFLPITSADIWADAIRLEMETQADSRQDCGAQSAKRGERSAQARQCIIAEGYDAGSNAARLQEIYREMLSGEQKGTKETCRGTRFPR